jgi:hypothetical protein
MNGAKEGKDYYPICALAWSKVLNIIHLAFNDGPTPCAFGVGILILIPKGVPDQYRGIALLEVNTLVESWKRMTYTKLK